VLSQSFNYFDLLEQTNVLCSGRYYFAFFLRQIHGRKIFLLFLKIFIQSLAKLHLQNGIEAKGVNKPPPAVREGGESTLGAYTISKENRSASI